MALAYKPNGKRWELGQRAAIVIALCTALAIEWVHAPNATIFLGPFYFAWSRRRCGVLCNCRRPLDRADPPAVKPCIVTACVSVVTFPFWLFLGLIGKGIGC